MLLEVASHALLDQETGSLRTDEVTPFNMAVHPAGQSVLLGLGSAGVRVRQLQEASSGPPTLTYAEGQVNHQDQHAASSRVLHLYDQCCMCMTEY